jgi:hypothetical protein
MFDFMVNTTFKVKSFCEDSVNLKDYYSAISACLFEDKPFSPEMGALGWNGSSPV